MDLIELCLNVHKLTGEYPTLSKSERMELKYSALQLYERL